MRHKPLGIAAAHRRHQHLCPLIVCQPCRDQLQDMLLPGPMEQIIGQIAQPLPGAIGTQPPIGHDHMQMPLVGRRSPGRLQHHDVPQLDRTSFDLADYRIHGGLGSLHETIQQHRRMLVKERPQGLRHRERQMPIRDSRVQYPLHGFQPRRAMHLRAREAKLTLTTECDDPPLLTIRTAVHRVAFSWVPTAQHLLHDRIDRMIARIGPCEGFPSVDEDLLEAVLLHPMAWWHAREYRQTSLLCQTLIEGGEPKKGNSYGIKIPFSYPPGVRRWPPKPSCAPIVDKAGLIVTLLPHFISSLRQAASTIRHVGQVNDDVYSVDNVKTWWFICVE